MADIKARTSVASSNESAGVFNGEKNDKTSNGMSENNDVDVKKTFKNMISEDSEKLHPSISTNDLYYNISNINLGVAVIFNQVNFNHSQSRRYSMKDTNDLFDVLSSLGFDVTVFTDSRAIEIKRELFAISQQDHSNNDCLLVVIMTHGERDGKIQAADTEFDTKDLWECFIGSNCESLIGKPKLFFVQACRGSRNDPGVVLKPKSTFLEASSTVDANPYRMASDYVFCGTQTECNFKIPTFADLLVMFSTVEGFNSFCNTNEGSWFIQALCEELKEVQNKELLMILTGVIRRVAFAKESINPVRSDWDAMKQMPNIVSMLTKTFYFTKKTSKLPWENACLKAQKESQQ